MKHAGAVQAFHECLPTGWACEKELTAKNKEASALVKRTKERYPLLLAIWEQNRYGLSSSAITRNYAAILQYVTLIDNEGK